MLAAPSMHRHRTPGILPAFLAVLGLLLLTAGAPASAQRRRATCSLKIIGSGGAFAAVPERSTDPDTPAGSFRVATPAQAPPDLRSVSLRCSSPQGPIPVGVDTRLITRKHLKGFSGVEVVDGKEGVAKACGIPPWTGASPEPNRTALLSFCGDFDVDFEVFSIQLVQLMHQLSKQRRSYLVVFGGGGDGSSVSAAIHQAQIINSTADSAVLVAGSSRVNISRLHCSGNMGRSGACIAAWNAAAVQLQHSSITNCSAAWGGGVGVRDTATMAIHNSSFSGCRGAGGGVAASDGATMAIHNSRFVGCRGVIGGAVIAGGNATASLFDSSFVNNSAVQGGAIACECFDAHSCRLQVVNGTFTRNTAAMFGGAVNAMNAVVAVNNTHFTCCSAGDGGGAVAAAYAAAVSVGDSSFTACNASYGGAIKVEHNTSLTVSDSRFTSNTAWSKDAETGGGGGSGGALAVVDNATALLLRAEFVHNSGNNGGAIDVECFHPRSCSLRLGSCLVQGNNATVVDNTNDGNVGYGGYGGGVSARNGSVLIADSQLLSNTAWHSGGGVYLDNSTLTLDRTEVAFNNASSQQLNNRGMGGGLRCLDSHVIVNGCSFSFNTAWIAGGGFHVVDSYIAVLNSTMLNNTCFGFSSAGGLMRVWGSGATPLEVVFGDNTTIRNSHADFGGALYVEFNSSAADESATIHSRITVSGSVLLQSNSASTGQDVIVFGRPFLQLDGSNLHMSNSSVMRQDLCAVGDSRSADGFCGLCPAQLFSLDHNHTQLCQPCPDHATCVGGAVVVADSGFFNSGNLSGSCNLSTIIRCPNPLACQHNESAVALHQLHPYFTFMTTINPLAPPAQAKDWTGYSSRLCATGYRGLLCGNCQDNFGQTDAFSCSACLRVKTDSGDGGINTQGIWGLLAAFAIIFVAMVWSTIAMNMLEHNTHASGSFRGDTAFRVGLVRHVGPTQEASAGNDDDELQLTDVIKALIMYAQYFAGIIAKLPVAWPRVLAVPLEQLGDSWSRAMGASASLDCVLKTLPDGIDPAGLKALINLLMPLAMLLFVLLCQTVWWACKRQCVWLLATLGLHVFKLLWPDGSSAGSTNPRISKFRKWCIQRQFYASRSSGWLRGVSGLQEYLRQRWIVSLLVTVFFFYPSVVRVAVGMFTCITVCDQRYWVMNMDKSCPLDQPTSVHGSWAFGVGIPALLILVAVPVSVAWLLWVAAHKNWLDKPWFQQFGFMFSDYRSESVVDKRSRPSRCSQLLVTAKQRVTLAWDAVIHMQTVVLVFMSVFGLVMHEYWQTLILAAVFGSYLLLVVWLQPFRGRYTQRLQAQSIAVLFATCCLVLTFIPPEGMDERQHKGYRRAADITGAALLALNIGFVAYGLALMLRRLSRMLRVLVKQRRNAGPPSGGREDAGQASDCSVATAATKTAGATQEAAALASLPRCVVQQQ